MTKKVTLFFKMLIFKVAQFLAMNQVTVQNYCNVLVYYFNIHDLSNQKNLHNSIEQLCYGRSHAVHINIYIS